MPTPHYPKGIGDAIASLRRDVQAARTQAQTRQPFRTIKAALLTLYGNLTVRDGGTITAINDQGQEIAKIGYFGNLGADKIYGLVIHRADGTEALRIYSSASGANTYTEIRDRAGNPIVSDDRSGVGLGNPYTPYPVLTPIHGWPGSSSSTWDTIADGNLIATHARIRAYALTDQDSGVTGEARILCAGQQVGSVATAPNDLFFDADLPGWGGTVAYQQELYFELQVRRTGGTGQVYAKNVYLYGIPSS